MATILIVDDEPANRLLMTTLLQHAGHKVVESENASNGMAVAREHCPDLIIVDLFLPGIHGTQFVKTLRGDERLRDTKIALYTGTQIDAMLADFMKLYGITHVIPKPAEPEELIRSVESALAP